MTTRRYCSVPQCKNYAGKGISMHYFPSEPGLREAWQIALKIDKKISKYMSVCSVHFDESDFHPNPLNIKKRYLKKGVIPSKKIPIRSVKSKLHTRRKMGIVSKKRQIIAVVSKEKSSVTNVQQEEIHSEFNTDSFQNLNILDKACDIDSKNLYKTIGIQNNICNYDKKPIDSILKYSNTSFKAYTGLHIDLFNALITRVENTVAENEHLEISDISTKILICLMKLKLNLPFKIMSGMFLLHHSNLKKSFEIMLPIIRSAIESSIYLPSIEENRKNMPTCFSRYKNTRIVLHCTEIPIQAPACLKCRTRTYSYYKSKNTLKYLIGFTPAGTISFVSPGYGGRASYESIFNNAGIINMLEPNVDALMVDKGFHIEKETTKAGIKLIRPPFLRARKQLTKQQADTTADIANARIHVKQTIQRLKMFKILSEKIPWTLVPFVDDAIVIIASLTNLSNPNFKVKD